MPAPTLSVLAPPSPATYPDGIDGIVRPHALVKWSGGTGPTYDVLHEWDTVNTFDSGALIQDSNTGVSGPTDEGVPPSDMGGGVWYYRVTVTDNNDSASTTSATVTLTWFDQIDGDRFEYLLANNGVAFNPTDTASGSPYDGETLDFDRFLYLLINTGVAFYPTDTLSTANPYDGDVKDFDRFLYLLAATTSGVPTPHIWYVFPAFGREGWEFTIVGYGFGDTQATYTGTATLNGLAVSVLSWELIAAVGTGMEIDPVANVANPVHQLITATVPSGGESGLVVVCTNA